MEDDFHNMRVSVRVADGIVDAAVARAIRIPYETCPAAGAELSSLNGQSAHETAHSVFRQTDARLQCTHMLELAGLAIAAAVRGDDAVVYDVFVSDPIDDSRIASLSKNSVEVLRWTLNGETIVAPDIFAGRHLRTGFARWALETLTPQISEPAMIMRRCAVISAGRSKNLEEQEKGVMVGTCFGQHPDRIERAYRIKGSIRDFSDAPDAPCQNDLQWVEFHDAPEKTGLETACVQ